jgi:hypothetical protein
MHIGYWLLLFPPEILKLLNILECMFKSVYHNTVFISFLKSKFTFLELRDDKEKIDNNKQVSKQHIPYFFFQNGLQTDKNEN